MLGEMSIKRPIRVNIPDTVVFKTGKPAFMIYMGAKDNMLKIISSGEKLKMHEIRKNFVTIAKARKSEKSRFT